MSLYNEYYRFVDIFLKRVRVGGKIMLIIFFIIIKNYMYYVMCVLKK